MKSLRIKLLITMITSMVFSCSNSVLGAEAEIDSSPSNTTDFTEVITPEMSELQNPLMVVSPRSRAIPPVPGDSEVLSNIFRDVIGTGPQLLTDKILQITPNKTDQRGALWSKRKLDLKKDFTIKSYLYLGDRGIIAADGITFTLQNDDRMVTNPKEVIGSEGMGIGVYASRKGRPYVRNALSLEFDTYLNADSGIGPGDRDLMDHDTAKGLRNGGHVGFATPKPNNNNRDGEHSGLSYPKNSPTQQYLSDGSWRTLVISWDAATQTMSYDLSGIGSNQYVVDDLQAQFNGDRVYWGMTASTGDRYAENVIAISELPQKLEQVATVENLTQEVGPAEEVEVETGDQINVLSVLDSFNTLDLTMLENPEIEIAISKGLKPDLDSIKISDEVIPKADITHKNDVIIIKGFEFANGYAKQTISYEAEVIETQRELPMTSSFKVSDDFDFELSKSNVVTVTIPKIKTGDLLVKYVDRANKELAPPKKETKDIGTKYDEQPIKIPGYALDYSSGNEKGEYEEGLKTIVFTYKEARFTLEQKVFNNDQVSVDGENVSNNQPLTYELTVNSLFEADDSGITYQTMTITNAVDENLTDIREYVLKTTAGTIVGSVIYEPVGNTLTAKLEDGHNILRSKKLVLSFKATVKKDVYADTEIKVSGSAEGSYSDDMVASKKTSQEVVSTVSGELRLASAPNIIDFGELMMSEYDQKISVEGGTVDASLLVEDTRKVRGVWSVTAQVVDYMHNGDDVRKEALRYVYQGVEKNLTEEPKQIYANDGADQNYEYRISDTWGDIDLADGLKLKFDSAKAPIVSNNYTGKILWRLNNTIE